MSALPKGFLGWMGPWRLIDGRVWHRLSRTVCPCGRHGCVAVRTQYGPVVKPAPATQREGEHTNG